MQKKPQKNERSTLSLKGFLCLATGVSAKRAVSTRLCFREKLGIARACRKVSEDVQRIYAQRGHLRCSI
jgi:hypothetical protein